MPDDLKSRDQLIRELGELREKLSEPESAQAERQQAVEALRYGEKIFRPLIENALDIIMILDGEAVMRYFSPSIEPVLGYKPEELIGQSAFSVVHPDDIPSLAEQFSFGVGSPGMIMKTEFRGHHKNGTWRILEVTGHNLLDHPVVAGVVVNFRDITERKQAEEALRESEERHRLVFENVSDVICVYDAGFKVLSVSPSVERFLGYKPSELVGRYFPDLNVVAPESLEAAIRNARRNLSGDRAGSILLEFVAKDGVIRLGEISGAPLMRDGKIVAVVIVGRDITERIEYENKLKSISRKVLEAQEEERARLARDLHDDLGQMLTAIQMDVSRLKSRPPETEEALGGRVDEIIGNIGDAAMSLRRICAGLRPPLLDDLGIVSALDAHARDFQARWGVKVDFRSEIGDVKIPAHTGLTLFRIAQEALTNVLRHAGSAEVVIEMKTLEGAILMNIEDNGKGFDPEEASARITAGLHGMRERAELCGGGLRILSAPGKGARIELTLPAGGIEQG